MSPIPHGGDPEGARRRLGLGGSPLLDFSASVNPLGPPPSAIAAARSAMDRVDRYPEPGCPRLTERLAALHGVPADRVIVGAGTTELIGLIGQSLREVLALHALKRGDPAMPVSHLVDPTFGEYRRASVLNEMRVESWSQHVLGWDQDFLPREAAGVFWTGHPNNPTGRAWDRDRLLGLVDDTLGLLTVADETFLPFLPDEAERSLIPAVPSRDNLLVLRSLSEVYAIPGLPVAYAVASPDMVERLRQFQVPWAVSLAAEAAALAAIDEPEHLARAVQLVASESARMLERLWDLPGLRPAWPDREGPGDGPPNLPNFLLTSLTAEAGWTSPRLHEALARLGLLVRECSDFRGLEVGALLTGTDRLVATQGHLRFSVRTPAENDALLDALAATMAEGPDPR